MKSLLVCGLVGFFLFFPLFKNNFQHLLLFVVNMRTIWRLLICTLSGWPICKENIQNSLSSLMGSGRSHTCCMQYLKMINKQKIWIVKVAHQLRRLTVLPEDLGLIPSTNMATIMLTTIIHLLALTDTANTWCLDRHAGKTLVCIK